MDIRVEQAGNGKTRLVVCGEFDLSSRDRFVAMVRQLMDGGSPAMIEVDLTGTSFLDASGVGALVDAQNVASAAGRGLRVRGATDLVLQVLEICGVVGFLGANADNDAAGDQPAGGG